MYIYIADRQDFSKAFMKILDIGFEVFLRTMQLDSSSHHPDKIHLVSGDQVAPRKVSEMQLFIKVLVCWKFWSSI